MITKLYNDQRKRIDAVSEVKFSNHRVKKSRYAVAFDPDSSLTDQSDALSVDINAIVRGHVKSGGLLQGVTERRLKFEDLSQLVNEDGRFELAEALDLVSLAKENFMKLPVDIRELFSNSPLEFDTFMRSEAEDDIAKAVSLGLKAPPGEEKPLPFIRDAKGRMVPHPDFRSAQKGEGNAKEASDAPKAKPSSVQQDQPPPQAQSSQDDSS